MRVSSLNRREFPSQTLIAGAWVASYRALGAQGRSSLAAGGAREFTLVARETSVELAPGRTWRTWAYNGQVPGPEIRAREGELVRVMLRSELPQPTSIHWHGLPVPNAMDGVPGVTQPPVMPGESFTYEFVAGPPGTYFYHSHAGLQLDRGLYGALIVEPSEVVSSDAVDREYVLMFDDWLDGAPEEAYARLQRQRGMGGGMMGGGDPLYAGYLLNGATSSGLPPLAVARGEKVRLRIINASSATTCRVGLAGHRLTVMHADGQPVRPIAVDSLVLGMGERYDAVVTADNPGAWPLIAGPADSVVPGLVARFVYNGTSGSIPPTPVWPNALVGGLVLRYADLIPVGEPAAPQVRVAQTLQLTLGTAPFAGYVWTINGQAYPSADPIALQPDALVRLRIVNATMMRHPMHLHGHFFRVRTGTGR